MDLGFELLIGAIIGFIASFIAIKSMLKKSGAGNCKMCETCDYKAESKKREATE